MEEERLARTVAVGLQWSSGAAGTGHTGRGTGWQRQQCCTCFECSGSQGPRGSGTLATLACKRVSSLCLLNAFLDVSASWSAYEQGKWWKVIVIREFVIHPSDGRRSDQLHPSIHPIQSQSDPLVGWDSFTSSYPPTPTSTSVIFCSLPFLHFDFLDLRVSLINKSFSSRLGYIITDYCFVVFPAGRSQRTCSGYYSTHRDRHLRTQRRQQRLK